MPNGDDHYVPAAAPIAAGDPSCTPEDRSAALRADQATILKALGPLTTLRDAGDVAALAGKGWGVLAHQFVSIGGTGVTIARTEKSPSFVPNIIDPTVDPVAGVPDLLFYRPAEGAGDVTDPYGPDFPYELAGWAYLNSYDYNVTPTSLPCIDRADWFVHERGLHPADTWGFTPYPPTEEFHGQSRGLEPFASAQAGEPHMRLWDVHVWRDGTAPGEPGVSILAPTPIAGVDPHVGEWYFYPASS
ncbi:hypothetical protein [Nocardia cyriacigeorgica]|uniref:hypothetical protein n=1 Tax=Nocardia cyriacigeorgica TaxID=135487 RepID=UPI002455DB24|nr:hypothetical protein [Nocardia cyriacigeorgica]